MEQGATGRTRAPIGGQKKASKTSFDNTVTDKWTQAISQQITNMGGHVNVQNVLVSSVKIDPNNARKFVLTEQEIKQAPKPFVEAGEGIDDAFVERIAEYFSDQKQEKEYLELCLLAESIGATEKLLNPITVYISGSDFNIVAGHRRYFAHLILGAQYIQAKILDHRPTEYDLSVLQWFENEHRQELALFDKIQGLRRIITALESQQKDKKVSTRELAKCISISKTTAGYFLTVMKRCEENKDFMDCLANGKVSSLEAAYRLSQLDANEIAVYIKAIDAGNVTQTDLISMRKTDLKQPKSNTIKKQPSKAVIFSPSADVEILAKITDILLDSPKLSAIKSELSTITDSKRENLVQIWNNIYEFLHAESLDINQEV